MITLKQLVDIGYSNNIILHDISKIKLHGDYDIMIPLGELHPKICSSLFIDSKKINKINNKSKIDILTDFNTNEIKSMLIIYEGSKLE